MKYEKIIIPAIKIHPTKIITYNQIHYLNCKPARSNSYAQQPTLIVDDSKGKPEFKKVSINFLNSARKSHGELSKQAKKKLTTAIEYFLMINKPSSGKSGYSGSHYNKTIAFITLTLPSKQVHSDNEIKEKCLNQFLIEMAKYHKVSQYIWRSEYQKNGNIHFHILVNRYIFWNDIRNRWNRIINKLGYVDIYRKELTEYHKNGFQVRADLLSTWDLQAQKKAYLTGLKTDWNNPNSIDVHKINNILNLKNYITKYMSKEEKKPEEHFNSQFLKPRESGRIWACSVIFSNIKGACSEIDTEIENQLKYLEEHFKDKIFKSDYFTILEIDIELIERLKCRKLSDLFFEYLSCEFLTPHQLKL